MLVRARWGLLVLCAGALIAALSFLTNGADLRVAVAPDVSDRVGLTLTPPDQFDRDADLESLASAAHAGELQERAALSGTAGPSAGARLTLRVAYRSAPVAHAQMWLTAGGLRHGTTDERGEVTFDVHAGRVSFGFDDVGGANSDGWFRAEGAPAATLARIEVDEGVDQVVSLALESAASVSGVVLEVDGAPAPELRFYVVRAEGDSWGYPSPVFTDESGRFAQERLTPGWILLGPGPVAVFPFERFELARGEHRDVELRLLPRRSVLVELDLVGEASGTPWTLPIGLRIDRAETLAGLLRTSRGMVLTDRAAPYQHAQVLSPGAHVVRVATRSFSNGALHVTAEWERSVEFSVEPGVETLRVEVPVPDPGPLAVVQCSVTVWGGASRLLASWTDRAEQLQERGLSFGADHCCTLTIDLDEVPSRILTIVALEGSLRRPLATLPLLPGHSSVLLTPGK